MGVMTHVTAHDACGHAVADWLADPVPRSFPFDVVLREIQTTGKHFLPQELLARLGQARAACPACPVGDDGAELLLAFLDCALDKRDGRYRYQSYLGLPLLDALLHGPRHRIGPAELVSLLVADALRYELRARHGTVATLPGERPDETARRKRLRYGLRLMDRHTPSRWRAEPGPDVKRVSGAGVPDPELAAAVDALAPPAGAEAGLRIELSMQPVYVLHDEYLFVRVLQSYETVFTALVGEVREARELLWRERPGEAAAALTGAAGHLDRAGLLFSLLATMRVEAFRRFREYTVGSSAIQSERYKTFECLCGSPQEERRRSPAFGSVPDVAAPSADEDRDSITTAYLAARERQAFAPAQWEALNAALTRLEHAHQHWKTAHHRLAARMIGEAGGSGYTAGVSYLADCLGNRLFWRLGERYLPMSRPGGRPGVSGPASGGPPPPAGGAPR
jgi:tryptophan 2,3-dioxygenase